MTQLYQWLQERAISFHSKTFAQNRERTLRTEITVEQHERTLLVCGHGLHSETACPLCGHVLLPNTPQPRSTISAAADGSPSQPAQPQNSIRLGAGINFRLGER